MAMRSHHTMRILGVYPYPFSRERKAAARESMSDLYIIEIELSKAGRDFDIGNLTQGLPGDPSAQVPYGEVFLSADGAAEIDAGSVDWSSTVRVAIWLHFVELDKPLHTPFGDVSLPSPSPVPAGLLDLMKYDLP